VFRTLNQGVTNLQGQLEVLGASTGDFLRVITLDGSFQGSAEITDQSQYLRHFYTSVTNNLP